MTNTFNINEVLYSKKQPIKLLGLKELCNKTGPSGIGYSEHRGKATAAAKFSGAAYVLDRIIVDKKVAVLESLEQRTSYTEFTDDSGEVFQCFVTEKKVIGYRNEKAPEGYDKLIPVVAHALSVSNEMDDEDMQELRSLFCKISEDYQTTGAAALVDVLQFCDSFYYGFVKKSGIDEYEELLAEVVPETMEQGYTSKLFEISEIFDVVEGKPEFKLFVDAGIVPRESNKAKKKRKVSADSLFEELKEKKHYIPYEWSEEQMMKIPDISYLDDFIPVPHFYSLFNKIVAKTDNVLARLEAGKTGLDALGKDYINSFIIGKPGTGKTTIAYALGAALGMPVYTVALTKNTEEDTFEGMTKVVDGGFKFVSTDFLDAYTNGGIIVLEEVNLADPAVVMGALGQAVEAPFILMRDGYQAVRRHPMCIILGTMNIGTYGSKGVSQAFSSRFKQTYILDDPKAEDFISILMKGGHSQERAKWVYEAYERINKHLKSPEVSREEICLNVTLRGCIGALECMDEGDDPYRAIYNSLVGKIAEVDLELASDIHNNVITSLPNLKL